MTDTTIPGVDGSFSDPGFKKLNASTIQLTNPNFVGQAIKVRCYGPAANVYSPVKMYNYVDNTQVINNAILWDPARGIHHPEAVQIVDVKTARDPAHYNARLDAAGTNTDDPTRVWGLDQVGKVWWNTANLDWKPYYDVQLTPSLFDRTALWGALADYSSVELYEWIQSPVAPANYIGSALNLADNSVPAFVNTVSRTRTWYIRPIAWRFSTSPMSTPRTFLASSPANLYLSETAVGPATATLLTGRLSSYGLATGSKFSLASYSSTSKTDATCNNVTGLAVATSDENFLAGSSTSYTAPALHPSAYFSNMAVTVYDNATFSGNASNFGAIKFNNVVDSNQITWIIVTCPNSGVTSKVQVTASSFTTGTQVSYKFPELGVMIAGTALQGSNDTWANAGTLTPSQLIEQLSAIFGSPLHDVVMRSTINVNILAQFYDAGTHAVVQELEDANSDTLIGNPLQATSVYNGWVAWNDPANLSSDPYAPYNQWQPLIGAYVDATDSLPMLSDAITADINTPFTTRAGTIINQFQEIWSNWTSLDMTTTSARYYQSPVPFSLSVNDVTVTNGVAYPTTPTFNGPVNFFVANFSFPLSLSAQAANASVFVNGYKITSANWNIVTSGQTIFFNVTNVNTGDLITIQIPGYQPTSAQLAYDPTAEDADPLVLTQYAIDYPHVVESVRSVLGNQTTSVYYFWVKGKCSLANANKSMSINQAASLLATNTDVYSILQVMKYYDQLNARPNRYSMLTVKGLEQYVRQTDTYKLRVTTDEAVRNTDKNMTLKNVHTEWKLLRAKQSTVIPKNLWDLLTDSVCGQNAIGQPIPSQLYQAYDDRNGTSTRYGFNTGQILVDSSIAINTITYTIQNTTINKYDSNYNATPDYISYPGFDMSQLSTYFATPTSSRQFLTNVWLNATPRQINEIFFAVLEDALTVNYEVTDFFKTSMIAMQEVQIVNGS